MATIELLYLETQSKLHKFERQVGQALEHTFLTRSHSAHVYTIKSRVKSFDSVQKKIRRKELDGLATPVSQEELLSASADIVGARVVFLFKDDVQAAFEHLKRETESRESRLRIVAGSDEYYEWGPWWQPDGVHNAAGGPNEGSRKHKESGYTSIHVHVTYDDPSFAGLKCELQLRTLLEEAWAEPNHVAAYKSVPSYHTSQQFLTLSDMLHVADSFLQLIVNQAGAEAKARGTQQMIQVTKSYPLPNVPIPPDIDEELKNAAALREGRRFRDAIHVHQDIAKKAYADGHQMLANHVKLEEALDYLYIGGAEELGLAEAIYLSLMPIPGMEMWCSFRQSYVRNAQQRYNEAILYSERALLLIRSRSDLTGAEYEGLEADILTWLGVCNMHRAKSMFSRSQTEEGAAHVDSAIQYTRDAISILESASNVIDAEGRRRQLERTRNNLAYYLSTKGDPELLVEAAQLIALVSDTEPNHVATKAWIIFKQALSVYDQKKVVYGALLREANRLAEQALHSLHMQAANGSVPYLQFKDVSETASIIRMHADNTKRYRPLDEFQGY